MVVIIDYGLGNLRSVAGSVEKVGHQPLVSHRVEDLAAADKLILPGVGAFQDGMDNLRRLGLVEPLTRLVLDEGKPLLGICLGCQLLARESHEFGHHPGLNWIPAEVVRIEASAGDRVPHVGWNQLTQVRPSPLFAGIPEDALFYYVHSYVVRCDDQTPVIGECEYGARFTAALQMGNIYGTQFHPEKSQLHGLRVLQNFLDAPRVDA